MPPLYLVKSISISKNVIARPSDLKSQKAHLTAYNSCEINHWPYEDVHLVHLYCLPLHALWWPTSNKVIWFPRSGDLRMFKDLDLQVMFSGKWTELSITEVPSGQQKPSFQWNRAGTLLMEYWTSSSNHPYKIYKISLCGRWKRRAGR